MTLNKDSHQTILNVKKLKNCIIISAALVEIRKKFFFRIIAQFQIKNIYLCEQTNKSSHNFMTFSHQIILVKKLKKLHNYKCYFSKNLEKIYFCIIFQYTYKLIKIRIIL